MQQQNGLTTENGFSRKWWVFLVVGIGTFMSALDASVVNIILPVLRTYFQSDVASVEWVVVIYLLVVSSLLLTFGRLGDLRGHKGMYAAGFLIFVAASAACGLAPTVTILVAARTVQAIGAGMLFANSPAILDSQLPPTAARPGAGPASHDDLPGPDRGAFIGRLADPNHQLASGILY